MTDILTKWKISIPKDTTSKVKRWTTDRENIPATFKIKNSHAKYILQNSYKSILKRYSIRKMGKLEQFMEKHTAYKWKDVQHSRYQINATLKQWNIIFQPSDWKQF